MSKREQCIRKRKRKTKREIGMNKIKGIGVKTNPKGNAKETATNTHQPSWINLLFSDTGYLKRRTHSLDLWNSFLAGLSRCS